MASEPRAGSESDRLIGQVLAERYRVEQRLGEGAMGTVFKARHVKVGRPFAVKLLHPHLLQDSKLVQRFEREAELAGRLRHPNVIGVVDVGETPDGLHYMVMDFAEGPDLASLMVEAPMPPPRIINLVRQLLEGLYHAHEQGLIHRDFKPANVIVERDAHGADVPRIVDFGIAILREGGGSNDGPGRLTTNGLVLGTPQYMAPEQAVADPVDHRIDLFALGIIIYELLCGKLPFDGTGVEVARANLLADPPPIAQRVPGMAVDPLLEAFANRLLVKKRDRRPATAKAARELLDLIERDRDAAAAVLQVSLAALLPITTQPMAPQGRASDGAGTYPPPFGDPIIRPPAPPMAYAMAVDASVPPRQITATQVAEPLAWNERAKRHAPIVGGVVVAIGIAGAAVAIVARGGGAPHETPVVALAVPDGAAPPSRPTVESIPDAQIEAQQTKPASVPTEPSDRPPIVTPKPRRVEPRPVVKAADPKVAAPAHVEPKPEESKPNEPRPVEPKPIETPTAVAAVVVTARVLAEQYQAVGRELKRLEQSKGSDVAADLWSRYRLIRITDAMSTQDKRDATATTLRQLLAEIAKLIR